MSNQHDLPDVTVDLLWKQFALNVDLYKFYLELVIKINVFYYGITGAIVSYYVQHRTDGVTRYALLLPILFSFALGITLLYGAALIPVVRRELFAIRDRLKLDTAPELMVLIVFLGISGVVLLAVGIVLTRYYFLAAV